MSNITECLSNIGNLLTGIGTACLAYAAIKTLPSTAANFLASKRAEYKFILAQRAIRAFHKFKGEIKQVRSVYGFPGEKEELDNMAKNPHLDIGDRMMAERYVKFPELGIVLLRLNKYTGSLDKIKTLEPYFKVVFNNVEPFNKIWDIRKRIRTAVSELINLRSMEEQNHQNTKEQSHNENVKKYNSIIYDTSDTDEINIQVNNAITQIEEICAPILSDWYNGGGNNPAQKTSEAPPCLNVPT